MNTPSYNKNTKKIIFSGGGTGGPVTPLLVVAEELLATNSDYQLLFVGTKNGPEKQLVTDQGIMTFHSIPAGKWRRYFSWLNFLDVFKIIAGFLMAYRLLRKEKPRVVVSAGGFVSVPLVWAAYFHRIPILIHQQDIRPGLANRLMARTASLVTVAFEKSLADYGKRAVWIGNPSRRRLKKDGQAAVIKSSCGLCPNKPLILVTGGGTGSAALNQLVFACAPALTQKAQIFHLTGKNKMPAADTLSALKALPDYTVQEFIGHKELFELMAVADLVVSRCGLATLTELCELSKPAILIPLPDSHQEDNAAVFAQAKAAIVLPANELNPDSFTAQVLQVLFDVERQAELSRNIGRIMKKDAAAAMAAHISDLAQI